MGVEAIFRFLLWICQVSLNTLPFPFTLLLGLTLPPSRGNKTNGTTCS